MALKRTVFLFSFFTLLLLLACNDGKDKTPATPPNTDSIDTAGASEIRELPHVKMEPVEYEDGIKTFNSVMAVDSANPGKKPIVLIIPEWWGLRII
ncbi:MAG TPA: hypothetical protein VF421_20050 [Niabella sp.]